MTELQFIERYTRCPLCQSLAIQLSFKWKTYGHLLTWDRCTECGIVFQNPRLTVETIASLYTSTSYFGTNASDRSSGYVDFVENDSVRRSQSIKRLAKILEVSPKTTGKLLDVGSASGFFGAVAKENGFDVTCVEPSASLAEFGSSNYGLKFEVKTIDDCNFPPESFDVITLWGTDSHFLHPSQSFEKLFSFLKPGGTFAMSYQDFSHWIRKFFPNIKKSWNVMYNFDESSIEYMLKKHNLEIAYCELEWQTVSIDHILRVVRFPSFSGLQRLNLTVPAISFRVLIAKKPVTLLNEKVSFT